MPTRPGLAIQNISNTPWLTAPPPPPSPTRPRRTWPPPAFPWWSSWGCTACRPGPCPCGSTRQADWRSGKERRNSSTSRSKQQQQQSTARPCGRVACGAAAPVPPLPTHPHPPPTPPPPCRQVSGFLSRPLQRSLGPLPGAPPLEGGWGLSIVPPPPPRGTKGHLTFVAARLGGWPPALLAAFACVVGAVGWGGALQPPACPAPHPAAEGQAGRAPAPPFSPSTTPTRPPPARSPGGLHRGRRRGRQQ